MSHLYVGIRLAIEGQCLCRPLYEDNVYLGFTLLGAGFTVEINRVPYRPGSKADLVTAIEKTGSNVSILTAIMDTIGVEEEDEKELFKNIKTMWALRKAIKDYGVTEEDKRRVIEMAKMLRFAEKHWKSNPEDFAHAAELLCKPGSIDDIPANADDLPIHPSYLYSSDAKAVVWSCFGGIAPTFRITGGTKISLDGDLTYTRSIGAGRGGLQKETLKMTELSCGFVVLDKAIEDLKVMTDEKSILNPLAQPRTSPPPGDRPPSIDGSAGQHQPGSDRRPAALQYYALRFTLYVLNTT